MGARDLQEKLRSIGISIAVDGDRLVMRPASKLTEPMRAALRESKPEMLALLRGELVSTSSVAKFLAGEVPGGEEASAFLRYRARLQTWACPEVIAKELAARLVQRDREGDERVSCVECQHYSSGSCWNYRRAGLGTRSVGSDMASMLQRCPGFDRA